MLTPFENAASGSVENEFNFYQSLAHIYVKCAFGEVDMRFEVFWKKLQYDLCNQKHVIDGSMHLHNYLVDWRNIHGKNSDNTSLYYELSETVAASNP